MFIQKTGGKMFQYISCFFFMVLFTICSPSFIYAQAEVTEIKTIAKNSNWQNTLQNLLETHGQLLNQINVAASSNKPKKDIYAIKQKLLSNAHDLAGFFDTHVHPKAGNKFEPLFDDHIKLGGEYIEAVKNHKPTNQIVKQALQNGSQIADLFSSWFPTIPNNRWQKMLKRHVTIEAKQTDAYFQKDITKATQWKDKSLVQLRQIGDLLIQGIKSKEISK
jgi:hypothetical protein